MNKPFLLIMGSTYYPERGSCDWKGCFETYQNASNNVEVIEQKKQKYGFASSKYSLKNEKSQETYDWYEIIDLREWTE